VTAGPPAVQAAAVQDDRHRQAEPGKAFRRDDHVRLDTVLLERIPGAGAPAAGLHLIDDQRDVQLPGGRGDPLHEIGRCRNGPALTLNELHDDSGRLGHPAVGVVQGIDQQLRAIGRAGIWAEPERAAVTIRVGREMCAGQQIRQALLGMSFRGERHRALGRAMVGALERDHIAAAGRFLAQLDGGLDGIASGRPAKMNLHIAADGGRQHGQLVSLELLPHRGGEVQTMRQPGQLILNRSDQRGMIVPQRQHPGAGQEVDVHPAVHVGDIGTRRFSDRHRQPPRIRPRARLIGLLTGQQRSPIRPRNRKIHFHRTQRRFDYRHDCYPQLSEPYTIRMSPPAAGMLVTMDLL
jgi:hypothetical protein